MAKDKKDPRSTKEGLLSKDAETILCGLMLSLVTLIGLLNKGPIGQFLTYCAVYIFGVFYFAAFILMLFTGVYLIFKKKMFKIRIDITILGLILLFVGISIASSPSDGSELYLNNVFSQYSTQVKEISVGVLIKDTLLIEHTGGGLFGYFLAALLNTAITQTGTLIVSLVLMTAGLVLVLYRPVGSLISYIKKIKQKRKERRQSLANDVVEVEEAVVETNDDTNDEYSTSVTTSQASRATFVFSGSGNTSSTTTPLADDIDEEEKVVTTTTTTAVFETIDEINDGPIDHTDTNGDEDIMDTIPLTNDSYSPASASKVTYSPSTTGSSVSGSTTISNAGSDSTVRTVTKPVIKGATRTVTKVKVDYVYPSLDLLNEYENADAEEENERVSIERQQQINAVLEDFKIGATCTGYKVGPSVTRFDILTNRDVSISSLLKYVDDISVRLGGMTNTRFEKVVKGKMTSGLEVPNARSITVSFKECIAPYMGNPKYKYKIPFGKNITGEVIGVNVTDFPHLLVAGSTGSGKSVFIHNLIMSLIMKTTPDDLKIMLIDPKRVEMGKYKEMPHLLCPIITEYDHCKIAMVKLLKEMRRRYKLFEEVGVSKISQYNEYAEEEGLDQLPVIVVVIDEYANLVENCKDITSPVLQLAAESRASGIHMVISTQRPSVNVITGVIKANLPTRVALRVASAIDSQTILSEGGAEDLLGYGDMLVDCTEISNNGFTRLQCAFVDNKEIRRVVEFLKTNYETKYDPEFTDLKDRSAMGPSFPGSGDTQEKDDRYDEAKELVMNLEEVSISTIQRKMSLGFPKAARIIDQLESAGVISKPGPGGKRKVLLRNQAALNSEGDDNDNESER